MIVRITRVKVGQRQAPITAPCSLRYRGLCIFNSGVNLKLSHKKTLGHILPQRFFMAGFQINTRAKNTKPPVA